MRSNTPERKPAYETQGKNINGYTVVKPIGEGKFSTVYKATAPDGKVIALKKIKVRISDIALISLG